MAHQYSRVGFKSSVEVNEVNLSLSYGGVVAGETICFVNFCGWKQGLSWGEKPNEKWSVKQTTLLKNY